MVALNQWTWVWVNSGSWWWTGRPGVLWSMGSQRVGHDWVTELNWAEQWPNWYLINTSFCVLFSYLRTRHCSLYTKASTLLTVFGSLSISIWFLESKKILECTNFCSSILFLGPEISCVPFHHDFPSFHPVLSHGRLPTWIKHLGSNIHWLSVLWPLGILIFSAIQKLFKRKFKVFPGRWVLKFFLIMLLFTNVIIWCSIISSLGKYQNTCVSLPRPFICWNIFWVVFLDWFCSLSKLCVCHHFWLFFL